MTKKKRRFEDWEYSQIHKEFDYTRHYEGFPLLDTWLLVDDPIAEGEKAMLLDLAKKLLYNAESWNEDELLNGRLRRNLIKLRKDNQPRTTPCKNYPSANKIFNDCGKMTTFMLTKQNKFTS